MRLPIGWNDDSYPDDVGDDVAKAGEFVFRVLLDIGLARYEEWFLPINNNRWRDLIMHALYQFGTAGWVDCRDTEPDSPYFCLTDKARSRLCVGPEFVFTYWGSYLTYDGKMVTV